MNKPLSSAMILFIGLFLANCGGNYNAERFLWKANQKAGKIFNNPKGTPDGQYRETIKSYEKVIRKYAKTDQAGEARLKMGLLYLAKEDFKTAQAAFSKVLIEHPDKIDLCANAQFNIGNCYEKAGNWEKARAEYNKTLSNYPKTRFGLQVPYYIASYHQQKKEFAEADKAYKEAIEIYKKIAGEKPKTLLNYGAQEYIILCYESQKKWPETINALQAMYAIYPDTPGGAKALITIGMIYQKQLNQPKKAIEVYEKFIKKYPKSEIVPNLKIAIKRLKPAK